MLRTVLVIAIACFFPLASPSAFGPPCDVCNVVVVGQMAAGDGGAGWPPPPGTPGCINFEVIPSGGTPDQVTAYSVSTVDLDLQHELAQLQESRLRGQAVPFGFQVLNPPNWPCSANRAIHLRIGNWQ